MARGHRDIVPFALAYGWPKQAVTRVTQTRRDVADVSEMLVEGRGDNLHVGVGGENRVNAGLSHN